MTQKQASLKYRDWLRNELMQKQSKNPAFSLRSFAKTLKTSPGRLSELLNGKRTITDNTAQKFAEKLCMSPQEIFDLMHESEISDAQKVISNDEFKLMADPNFCVLLELFDTKDFDCNHHWIAGRIGLTPKQVEEMIARLERLKLIELKDNQYVKVDAHFTTTTDVPSQALVKSHLDSLDKAKEILQSTDVSQRDFNSLTIACSPQYLPEIKKRIRDFQLAIIADMENLEYDKSQVFQLNIQFFQATK